MTKVGEKVNFVGEKKIHRLILDCGAVSQEQKIPRKRIKDKDAKMISTVAISRSVTTDVKAVGITTSKVETMVNNDNMQTLQLLLDRNTGSQCQSSINVGQAAKLRRGYPSLRIVLTSN